MTYEVIHWVSLLILIVAGWDDIARFKWSELDFKDKDTYGRAILIGLAGMLAPWTLGCFLIGHFFEEAQRKKNKRINRLIRDWEDQAAIVSKLDRWSLSSDKHKYQYHQAMRETVRGLSDADLKLITSFDPTYMRSIDKEVVNAAIDELCERAIINGGK